MRVTSTQIVLLSLQVHQINKKNIPDVTSKEDDTVIIQESFVQLSDVFLPILDLNIMS